jgi:hypothetical protein
MICYAKALVAARMRALASVPADRPARRRRRFRRRRAAAAVVVTLGSVAAPQLPSAPTFKP